MNNSIFSATNSAGTAEVNLQATLICLESIMRQAGSMVMTYFHKGLSVQTKNDSSIVTEADIACEKFLIQELSKLMPQAAIIAEESGMHQGSSDYFWVIDPIDGTTNFSRGLPYFCISVALVSQGKPVIGAVYNPVPNEFFSAIKGEGAYLNGHKIRISDHDIGTSVLVIGLPSAKDAAYKGLLQYLLAIAPQTFAIRHFCAAALDLAHVACGRLDGHFAANLAWWDVAAGMLLVTEAGGLVTDFEGNELTSQYRSIVAGGPKAHAQLRAILAQAKA